MATPDEEFQKRLREAFAIEAQEHLQATTAGLLELEGNPEEARRQQIIETIFREAHSLKGAARAVNRTDIESLCQSVEAVFSAWKKGNPVFSPAVFDVLNQATDAVARLLTMAGESPSTSGKGETSGVIRRLEELLQPVPAASASPAPSRPSVPKEPAATAAAPRVDVRSEPPAPGPEPVRLAVSETVRMPLAKMDSLLRQAEEMLAVKLTTHQHALDLKDVGQTLEMWKKEWGKTFGERGAPATAAGSHASHFLEWNHSYMRALENKVASLARTAEANDRSIGAMVDNLLEDAKRLVMLPFGTLLEIIPKMARSLARGQGKEVEVFLQGREVEIDKRILEEMKDPLIHLVRNSIDHGIETPDLRAQRGKPARGLLSITVSQVDGNKVEIVMADDGGGIDIEKVKASAVDNGVLTAEEAGRRTGQEALALIFQSGISTSAIITEISGRGLGMAIVSEKVEKLGGRITIENRPPHGTTFRIVLPVTLSTFKGLLVESAGHLLVIPTASMERVVRLKRTEVHSVENRETISVQGRALSLVRLEEVLELPPAGSGEESPVVLAVVIGAGEQRVAFLVDQVLDEQEVLVKNIGPLLARVRNIAGATVLGSGKVVPILNPADLLKSAAKTSGAASRKANGSEKREVRAQSLLVVDDSVTSRMLLKNILEAAGYKVKTAVDGLEAWTALKTQPFDLIVSDVEMPRMNGFSLTEKVRADQKLAELPVVLVTALESREDRERGVDVGANADIVKSSFDQSNLLEVVRRLV